MIVHPGYEQKIFRHDIALIVLKDEVKYSGNKRYVALINDGKP